MQIFFIVQNVIRSYFIYFTIENILYYEKNDAFKNKDINLSIFD